MGPGSPPSDESVIVVLDANRSRNNFDALNWALKSVVRPRDTVIVLGILSEAGRKTSCFPIDMGIGISAIWEKLDFSSSAEKTRKLVETPKLFAEEIERKRVEYQCSLQPYYRQCKKNEVKLEVQLTAGCPQKLTIEEAQSRNTHWIVLDSHLKKDKVFIYDQVGCSVALMKTPNLATIMTSPTSEDALKRLPAQMVVQQQSPPKRKEINTVQDKKEINTAQDKKEINTTQDKKEINTAQDKFPLMEHVLSTTWAPLSWQFGYPRSFALEELESVTNGFADDAIIFEEENLQVYRGIVQNAPVLVKYFYGNPERFWSELKILSRVRHRNLLNIVGYCCTEGSMFLLTDYPMKSSLDLHLRCDDMAENLSWKVRWDIALEIAGCLSYLHEECLGGPIYHLSISSANVLLSNNYSVLLTNFSWAKWLEDSDRSSSMEDPVRPSTLDEEHLLSLDVRAYGLLLMELITGHRALRFNACMDGQILVDQVLPLLESGPIDHVIDPRVDSSHTKEIGCMVSAALLCLKNSSGHQPSMREVGAVIRGTQFATSRW